MECEKGEYCSREEKGCVEIPQCESFEARENGFAYGKCIKCEYDDECRWEGAYGMVQHPFCWTGDGLCREHKPLTLETYSWRREYDVDNGFVDKLTPTVDFQEGQTICFLVSTPLPPNLSAYLHLQIDKVEMCALKQTSYEALIRLKEAARVEDHHQVQGVHRHHGILPYDPRNHTTTGCRTDQGKQFNRKTLYLNQSTPIEEFDHEKQIPDDIAFTIVDSQTGASALCSKAVSISPDNVPMYIEVGVSVFHSQQAVKDLLQDQVRTSQTERDDIAGMLAAYGVISSERTRSAFENLPDHATGTEKRWSTLVVSDLDHDTYVVCPSGYYYDGKHGYCTSTNYKAEVYLWLTIFAGAALVIGGFAFCAVIPYRKPPVVHIR